MTHGFQHQDTTLGFTPLRSVASPQHGQKASAKPPPRPPEPRSFPSRAPA